MIALKRVKTLPATMLAVEREEVSGGGPSLRSRAAASLLESPASMSATAVTHRPLFNRVRGRWA